MRKGFVIAAVLVVGLGLVSLWRFSSPPAGTSPKAAASGGEASRPGASREAGTVLQPERAEDVGARGTPEAGSTPALVQAPSEADGVLEVEVLAGGKPVPGARARLYWRGERDPNLDELSWRLASAGTTDATGRARLPSRPGAYLVAVRAQGLAPRVRDVVRPYGEALTRVRLTLEAGAALTGRTVVRDTNEPLPMVELVLTPYGREEVRWQRVEAPAEERVYASSDERGAFRVEGLAPGRYLLEASTPGHARTVVRDVRLPARGPLTVALPRAATLEGFVVDAEGRPAAGAEVQLSGRVPQTVTTGEGGGFSVEVEAGAHRVSARRGAEAGSLDRPVVVAAGQTVRDVRVVLGAGASIEGRVVARSGGAPVAGASVDVSPFNTNGDLGRARTDAAGAFAVRGLAPGSYDVVVRAPGYAEVLRRGLVVAAGERFSLEVQLPGTGAVRGVVRDSAGRPLEGVVVSGGDRWGGALGATAAEARTDAEGRYLLGGLTADRVYLTARHEASTIGSSRHVDVVEGSTVEADFTLAATGTVEGVVRAASGRLPEEPLLVAALPQGAGRLGPLDIARTEADAAGRFRMTLPEGAYGLNVRPSRRGTAGMMKPVPVNVEAGKTTSAELTLSEEPEQEGRVLRGRVLEADGGAPAQALVRVSTEGRGGMLMSPVDEEGRFELTLTGALAAGPLTVVAQSGGRTGTLRGVTPDGREVVVRLEASASVRGRVVRPDGQPVKGFHLSARVLSPGRWSPPGNVWEFPADRFELKDVPGERLQLTVRTTDGVGGEAEVALAPGASAEVDVTLQALAGVRGRVVDATTRAPVEDAYPFIEGTTVMASPEVHTDAQGRFLLDGLTPGERSLRVAAPEGRSARLQVTLREGQVLDLGDIAVGPPLPTPP